MARRRIRRVRGGEDFAAILDGLSGEAAIDVMKYAVYEGCGVLADALKHEIQNLPVQSGYIANGKKRDVIGTHDKEMLQRHMGISKIRATAKKANAIISFTGYNDRPTKKYPHGVPIQLIARSIESGSSIRKKNPFIRRAYNSAKETALKKAIEAGQAKINEQIR